MAKIANTNFTIHVNSGSKTNGTWYYIGTVGYTNCYAERVSYTSMTAVEIIASDGTFKGQLQAGNNNPDKIKIPDNYNLLYTATSDGNGYKTFEFCLTGDPIQTAPTPQADSIIVSPSQISISSHTLQTGDATIRIGLSNTHPDLVSHRIDLTFGSWTNTISVPTNSGYYDLSIPHSVFSSGNNAQAYANTDKGTLNIKVTTINNDENKEFTPCEHDITLYLNPESNNLPTMTNFEISATRSTTLVNIENDNDELPSGVIIQDLNSKALRQKTVHQ